MPCNSLKLASREGTDVPATFRGNCAVTVRADTNENPGALAGATGVELHSSEHCTDHTLNWQSAAMALADAAEDCPPEIRARLLERLLDAYRPAWPQTPFLCGLMEEARFWAGMASRAELKAYALACREAMPEADRKSFIVYISGGVAV